MDKLFKDIVRDICNIDCEMEIVKTCDIEDVRCFPQVWGSTALGFGGVSGNTLTTAITTVVRTMDMKWYVFFGGRIAYCIEQPSEEFFKDLQNCQMKPVNDALKLY